MDKIVSEQSVKDWLDRWTGYLDEDMIYRMKIGTRDIPPAEPYKDMTIGEVFKAIFPDLEAEKIYYDNEPLMVRLHCSQLGQLDLTLKTWERMLNYQSQV